MAINAILDHILGEANTRREKIIQETEEQAEKILQEARKEAEKISQEIITKEKNACESQRQKLIVNGRLQAKKNLLGVKQELIDNVFKNFKSHLKKDKFKKQQIALDKTVEVTEDTDFYLNKIRPDYEAEIARILFT